MYFLLCLNVAIPFFPPILSLSFKLLFEASIIQFYYRFMFVSPLPPRICNYQNGRSWSDRLLLLSDWPLNGRCSLFNLVDSFTSQFPWEREHIVVPLLLHYFWAASTKTLRAVCSLARIHSTIDICSWWRTDNQPTFDPGSSSSQINWLRRKTSNWKFLKTCLTH